MIAYDPAMKSWVKTKVKNTTIKLFTSKILFWHIHFKQLSQSLQSLVLFLRSKLEEILILWHISSVSHVIEHLRTFFYRSASGREPTYEI